jgi:outer membrane protein OmpA-like peptidoglycan-associated protein
MKLNKKLSLVCLSLLLCAAAQAQEAQESSQPLWQAEFQTGLYIPVREGSFLKTISPSFSLYLSRQLTEEYGVRAGLGGFRGKGYVIKNKNLYSYSFLRTTADFMWMPLEQDRKFYAFGGLGLLFGTRNGANTVDIADYNRPEYFSKLWQAPHVFLLTRVGAGYSYPVAKNLSVGGEVVMGILPDKINSKNSDSPDFHFQLMVGVKYAFDFCKRKKAQPAPAPVPVPAPAPAPAPAPVVEPEPAPAPAPVVIPEPEPEPVVDLEAQIAAEAASLTANVYFDRDSAKIKEEYQEGLAKIAAFLQAHPEWKVRVFAYCDSRYGSAAHNKELSVKRANAAKKAIVAAGAASAQVISTGEGGTDIFSKTEYRMNRVVVCELTK